MPANVETMAYVKDRGVPWHGIGTPADGLMTAAEVLEKAGLDWVVERRPLYIEPKGGGLKDLQLVRTHQATVRVTDNQVLGIVGNRFTPVQNGEALRLLDDLVDSGEGKYDTAGSLNEGRRVFISMELPKHIGIKGDESPYNSYLSCVNGHDGWTAFQVVRTTVRMVCSNTVDAGLERAMAKYAARHTQGVTQRVGEIREALGVVFRELDDLSDLLQAMTKVKVTEKRAKEVLLKVFPLADSDKGTADLEIAKSDFAAALSNWRQTETINDKLRGTNYGLYQAVAEYADWGLNYRNKELRVSDLLLGQGRPADAKKKALALLRP